MKRFNVVVAHRRFGKTVYAVNELIDRLLHCTHKNPQGAYIAPTYSQAKRVVWQYFKDFTACFPNRKVHEGELRIDIPMPTSDHPDSFFRIMLLGADNPDNIRGIYLDHAVLDEYGDQHPQVWTQVVRPALSDRKGGALFIGTPKGANHFQDIYLKAKLDAKNWHRAIFKASETKVIDPEELESSRLTMAESDFEQEFECSFSAQLKGAYYGAQIRRAENEGRVCKVPYDLNAEVHTYWDLGIGDTTVIWFAQMVGKEVHFIDYYEASGVGLEHYAALIKSKPYNYGEHLLPHDGGARELGTGVTRQETLRNMGITPIYVQKRHKLDDGINASRILINRSWFDVNKCERGITALKNYQRKWDEKNQIFSPKPLHDWSSHAADAFRTCGMGMRADMTSMDKRALPRQASMDTFI
jgi:hypothetical protein